MSQNYFNVGFSLSLLLCTLNGTYSYLVIMFCTLTLSPFIKQKHRVELFQKLRHVMNELMDLRRQLILGHMTQEQSREVKRHITLRLDWGNE